MNNGLLAHVTLGTKAVAITAAAVGSIIFVKELVGQLCGASRALETTNMVALASSIGTLCLHDILAASSAKRTECELVTLITV